MEEVYLLTQQEAFQRSSVLSDISYRLRLTLTSEDSFAGILQLKFSISDPSIPMWLDFKGTSITSLSVNTVASEVSYSNAKLMLPNLVKGENTATVYYQNKYSMTD